MKFSLAAGLRYRLFLLRRISEFTEEPFGDPAGRRGAECERIAIEAGDCFAQYGRAAGEAAEQKLLDRRRNSHLSSGREADEHGIEQRGFGGCDLDGQAGAQAAPKIGEVDGKAGGGCPACHQDRFLACRCPFQCCEQGDRGGHRVDILDDDRRSR